VPVTVVLSSVSGRDAVVLVVVLITLEDVTLVRRGLGMLNEWLCVPTDNACARYKLITGLSSQVGY